MRARVLGRSRFAEDQLAEAVRRGIKQFIMLGAGMDTFTYRQPAWASGLRILELDHPASQSAKRRELETARIPTPPNLEYVEVDFEHDSIRSALEHSHFNFNESAFFSCLGVLMYLTEQAVDAILHFLASTPQSSEIVFTFASDGQTSDSKNQAWATERQAESVGEPWLTKFQPDALNTRLSGWGFSEVTFLSPDMIAERYMHDRRDDLPVPRQAGIVSAKV